MRSVRPALVPVVVTTLAISTGVLGVQFRSSAPAAASPRRAAAPTARQWQTGISAGVPSNRPAAQRSALMVNADGELPSLRTRTSSTFESNGKLRTVFSVLPVNYQAADGSWQRVDDSLAKQPDGSYANKADDFQVSLPSSATHPVTARKGSSSVTISMVNPAPAPATVAGSSASYRSIGAGVDALYRVGPDVLEQTYRLASAAVPRSYQANVTLSAGLSLRAAADRSLSIVDAAGKLVGSLPAPV